MGKSTLVNSLFLTDLYKYRKLLNAEGEPSCCLLSQNVALELNFLCLDFSLMSLKHVGLTKFVKPVKQGSE